MVVLESRLIAPRHNLDGGSGCRMRAIGDNQLAHLGREKCSQCAILVMSYLEFIPCVQGGGGETQGPQYAFSNLRHLQDLPLP